MDRTMGDYLDQEDLKKWVSEYVDFMENQGHDKEKFLDLLLQEFGEQSREYWEGFAFATDYIISGIMLFPAIFASMGEDGVRGKARVILPDLIQELGRTARIVRRIRKGGLS